MSRDDRLALLLLAIVVMQIVDWTFTMVTLSLGATELNPLMAWVLSEGSLIGLALKVGVTVGLAALVLAYWRGSALVLRGVRVVFWLYLFVLAWNLGVLAVHGSRVLT